MGQTSKPLFTFRSCWEYLSTLINSLLQLSEPARCLAIAKPTVRLHLLNSIQGKGSSTPWEDAFSQDDPLPHYHSLAPSYCTTFQRPGSLGSMNKYQRTVSLILIPLLFQVPQQIHLTIVGFPCLQHLLDLRREKNNSLPFPFHSLVLQTLHIMDRHSKMCPYIYIYFSNIYTDFLKTRKKFICSNISKY